MGFITINNSQAQKLIIDSNSFGKWPSYNMSSISPNGEYIMYNIQEIPEKNETFVIKATNSGWHTEIKNEVKSPFDCHFALDGMYSVFITKNEELKVIQNGTTKSFITPNIRSYKILTYGKNELIGMMENNSRLILKNLISEKEIGFDSVIDFLQISDGNLIIREKVAFSEGMEQLRILNLNTLKSKVVWTGGYITNIVSNNGVEIYFKATVNKPTKPINSFWQYNINTEQCKTLLSDESKQYTLNDISKISKDGFRIFFHIQTMLDTSQSKGVDVNIWSYTDHTLQSQQLEAINSRRSFLNVLNLKDRKVISLENPYEHFEFIGDQTEIGLIKKTSDAIGESTWNKTVVSPCFKVSLTDGTRFKDTIPDGVSSPHGDFIIYYDRKSQCICSYELHTNKHRVLTNKIRIEWSSLSDIDKGWPENPRSIGGWSNNGKSVYVCDRYDIWMLDPSGISSPVNLTNGYGKRNKIIFQFTIKKNLIDVKSGIFLTAFNTVNNQNGFFSLVLGSDPKLCFMGNEICDPAEMSITGRIGIKRSPIKADKAKAFLVVSNTEKSFPNLFYTNDFRLFKRITNYQPQKKYNWYSTELITWKGQDGSDLKGVLYKPDDFDPNKKYPVIFNYYDKVSDNLHEYLNPSDSGLGFNIPSFVSSGYLVFTPDILFSPGNPGKGVLNSIIPAVKYISSLPYVDGKKIGATGISFGGWSTNYLLSHTDLFAAACTQSGVTDMISNYNSIREFGSNQGYYELGQGRMSNMLWENMQSYISNSPVYRAEKVTTPFLMFHTTNDGAVDFNQALEFFIALRRLGKKVWMLEYPNGNHGVWGREAIDFSIRLKQFFDYYLKDNAAPRWMIQGIPANKKGIKDGLDLQPIGVKPGDNLLTPEAQFKIDSLQKQRL
jgi:dienelactone hydrolase